MNKRTKLIAGILVLLLATLACQLGAGNPTPNTGLINTQIALAMTQTALAGGGFNPVVPTDTPQPPSNNNNNPGLTDTQVALALTQTAISQPPAPKPSDTPNLGKQPLTNDQIQALIDSSNILVYEEMAGDPQYLPYVARALKSVGGHHEYVGDAMGTFMDQLNSGTHWDLIIVAAENRLAISGDYWTQLKDLVDGGAGLIAEVWYLDSISGGKISPFLYECGVDFQKDWQRKVGDSRLDFEMYWTVPDSPVFNTPNKVNRFGASLSDPAWYGDIGDFLQVRSGGNARILASHVSGQTDSFGLITECYDGRVLFQTFSSHDYPTNDMIALWNNYIVYTLTNHFKATH